MDCAYNIALDLDCNYENYNKNRGKKNEKNGKDWSHTANKQKKSLFQNHDSYNYRSVFVWNVIAILFRKEQLLKNLKKTRKTVGFGNSSKKAEGR